VSGQQIFIRQITSHGTLSFDSLYDGKDSGE